MSMSARTRLRLRLTAAELTFDAMEATEEGVRKRLMTEAQALIHRLDADQPDNPIN